MTLKTDKLISALRLSKKAFGKYRLQIIILIIFGFIGGILEGIGINAVIPLLSLIIDGSEAEPNIFVRIITAIFGLVNLEVSVVSLLIFISVLFFLKAMVVFLMEYVKAIITTDYELAVRSNLYTRIVSADWMHLLKQKLGYLDTILLIDVPASAILLREIGTAIMVGTSLLVYIILAINISFWVTVVTIVIGAVIFLIMRPLLFQVKRYSHKVTNINKEVGHHVNETIFGLKTVKTMNVAENTMNIGNQLFDKLRKVKINIIIFKNLTGSFIQPISIVFVSIVFVIMYQLPGFNFATLFVVFYLIDRIFIYIKKMEKSLHMVTEYVPYLRSVVDYQEQSDIHQEIDSGVKSFEYNQSIEFKDVSFYYREDKSVLENLNFKIEKGEMIGFIGPSGSGKTTVVDLMLRLINPISGQILLDGTSVHDIKLSEWRKNIGYVSQDIFLINDTIENNIRFYDDTITDNEIIEAAKMANIYNFIIEQPDGMKTFVGDRGVMLSGGQRQRVVLARILARKPKILILDEATSSLDTQSEVKIQELIKDLKKQMTIVVVAHRLSTIIDTDRLFVISQGKIIESGKPRELLNDEKTYFYKAYNIR